LSGTQAGPDLGAEIKRLAQVAYDKANAKWKAGVAVQADTSRVGCQEVLVDPNIKIDSQHSDRREAPTFKDDTQMGNMRDLNDGVLLGEWRPEHQGKTGSYDRFYAVGKGAGGALVSAKNAVSKFVDTFYIEATQEAREVVEMVNTWTDRAEQKMKSASEAGLRAISGALDGAIAVAAGAADQAKQKVVGVVGEAKRASAQGVGMIALAAMDKIPAIDTMEPMSPKTVALLQVAGLAGALLVGVSMAPVVGLATATVGAAAAGYGVGSALNKFAGVFRSSMAELPGKLESFAGKLGARRGGKLVSVEPSVGRENGPGLGAFGAQGF
jgi:hypothetical protein